MTSQYNIKTQRGEKTFCDHGFRFIYDKSGADGRTDFWRCAMKDYGCLARIHVKNNVVVLRKKEHTGHTPDPGKLQAAEAVTAMKRKAEEGDEATSVVISSQLSQVNESSLKKLPTSNALKQRIRRVRKAAGEAPPPQPGKLSDLDNIPERYTKYCPSPGIIEKFLLHDSGIGANRILIFGRPNAAEILGRCRVWYGDGTFSVTPKIFYQTFVLYARRYGAVHPLLYALLPNKTKTVYRAMFKAIQDLSDTQLQPKLFSCDYKLGLMNSFLALFPSSEIAGCLFHLSQSVQRHVAEVGLQSVYENDVTINEQVKMISALAFIPCEDVCSAFEELQVYVDDRLNEVIAYFEDNYIGRLTPRGRRPPRFKREWWNVYSRVMNDDPRTNNNAEGGHRRLQNEFSYDHPTLWRFVDVLRRFQKGRDHDYHQSEVGSAQVKKRRKYAAVDKRLKTIVEDYPNRSTIEYLIAIAHNIHK